MKTYEPAVKKEDLFDEPSFKNPNVFLFKESTYENGIKLSEYQP